MCFTTLLELPEYLQKKSQVVLLTSQVDSRLMVVFARESNKKNHKDIDEKLSQLFIAWLDCEGKRFVLHTKCN